ncbi:MAG TPA: phospholipid carrier-dependent glycosyltransferase [Chloroflexi bacterium]|nr:phospholipid carrier-dependent glycosyltransferase [Chloroflexota bacterium]
MRLRVASCELRVASCKGRGAKGGSKVQRPPYSRRLKGIVSLYAILFFLLGSLYSLVTPVFEASDELWHFTYAAHIARTGGLPNLAPGADLTWWREGHQPPLYYILAAIPIAITGTDGLENLRRLNPHTTVGNPLAPGNKNIILHNPETEAFPWRGAVLAIHLVRLLSVLMGTGTVVLTGLLARELGLDGVETALALSLTAFNPMFLFISGSVNNDNLTALLGAAVAVLLIRLLRDGVSRRRALLLGALLGLGALTKFSLLTLLPIAGIVAIWDAWRRRSWLQAVQNGLLVGVPLLIIAGWWYGRNWMLYGDPGGFSAMLRVAKARTSPPGWREFFLEGEFRGVRYSYWAVFGGFNILADRWIYPLLDILSILAITGMAWWMAKAWLRGKRELALRFALLWAWVGVVFASLVRFTRVMAVSQGRLMFVAISAISVLGARGLASWATPRIRRWALLGVCVAFLIWAAVAPFRYIRPAYAKPPLLDESQVPTGIHRLDWVYSGVIRLIGVEIYPKTLKPGDKLHVRAYWQLLKSVEEDYSIFVHVWGRGGINPEGRYIASLDTYPGLGSWPTSLIPPGKVVADEYVIRIPPDAEAPAMLTVEMGVYEYLRPSQYRNLAGVDAHGDPVTAGKAGYVALIPHRWPSVPPQATKVDYRFGDAIRLAAFEWADGLLRLYWQAEKRPDRDYTVFVHVLDETGKQVAVFDSMPMGGDFPTSFWPVGALVVDEHRLDLTGLEPGRYSVEIGLYSLDTMERLPATGPQGSIPDRAVKIAEFVIK